MQLTVYPNHPLRGELVLPGDKSLSHRALLFATLAEGESRVDNFLVSGVTRVMLTALADMGVEWSLENDSLRVQGKGLAGLRAPGKPLNCGNSATTLRLLTGLIAAAGVEAELTGSEGLRKRPMERIVDPLRQMGVAINAAPGGTAPLRVAARPSGQALRALDETLPVASAQVKTCLLLAALAADGDSTLREPGPSRDHTERMLGSMGVQVQHTGPGEGAGTYTTRLTPPGPSRLKPLRIRLPGDISSAAFLIVAGLITPGSEVRIRGVGLNPTRTGLLDALKAMGADLTLENLSEAGGEPSGDVVVTASRLTATQVHGPLVVRMIDEFTVFGTAAAYAAGCTTVREARELRFKESDRVASLCAELTALGVRCEEHPDGFNVWGGQPVGGQAQSHGDHRLAMAMTVAGLAAGAPVTVNGAEMIAESFPGFTAVLRSLGARIEDNGGETAGGRLPSTAAQGTP